MEELTALNVKFLSLDIQVIICVSMHYYKKNYVTYSHVQTYQLMVIPIRILVVLTKKLRVLSYSFSAQRRL